MVKQWAQTERMQKVSINSVISHIKRIKGDKIASTGKEHMTVTCKVYKTVTATLMFCHMCSSFERILALSSILKSELYILVHIHQMTVFSNAIGGIYTTQILQDCLCINTCALL